MNHSLRAIPQSDNASQKEETQTINTPSTMTLSRKTVSDLDYIKRENSAKRNYAVRVSVIEGAARLAEKYRAMGQSNTENYRAINDDSLGATSLAFAHLIVRHSEAIAACMKANDCNQARAIEIIFSLGAERGHHNGYRLKEEASEERQRA